jgi:hypothetical protein
MARGLLPASVSKESIDMSKEAVDLLSSATMSVMYLNVLAVSNLLLLSAPWVFMQRWMKGLEGGSVAAPEQKEPLSDNRQIAHMPLPRGGSLNHRHR